MKSNLINSHKVAKRGNNLFPFILQKSPQPCGFSIKGVKMSKENLLDYLAILTLLFALLLVAQVKKAHSSIVKTFTYSQLADAIYHAEGGNKAQYLYGIRSVHYDSRQEARRICLNTIRNNMRRFKEYGYREYADYLSFLASRYAPVSGENLSKAERKLNKYWLNNVKYFLNNPKEVK